MNLRFLKTGFFIAFAAVLVLVSCNKSTVAPAEQSQASYDAQVLIDAADVEYNNVNITGGSETESFSSLNDGLPEAYTLEEVDMDNAGYKRADDKRFFACLKKLDLTDTQNMRIRKVLKGYEACKAMDIQRHREAYNKLIIRIESTRKEYISQLKNGKITKAQFEEKMKALRADYEKSMRAIKESFAKNLKGCYDKYMRGIKEILTERQWKAFADCYR